MSATPAETASKVSNARTRALAGNTSILMRPLVASPIVCASRRALGSRPGMVSGQSVTIVSCRDALRDRGRRKARGRAGGQ